MTAPAKDPKSARGTAAATASQSPSATATTASTTSASSAGTGAKAGATGASATAASAPAAPATTAAAGSKPDTLVGEVIDIQCLARQERQKAQGAAQDAKAGNLCGTDAVRSGAPVGIRLRDGNQVYVVAMHNRKPAGRTLAQYVGREVTVAGWRLTEGGVPLVEITKVIRAEDNRTSRGPEAD